MNSSLTVKNKSNGISFTHSFENDQIPYVSKCMKGHKSYNFIQATLIPVRTHNAKDFCKDLFLPNVVNRALKVNHVAARLFATVLAFVFDVVTFPIRLVRCIPRMIANKKRKETDLAVFLKEVGADPKIFEGGVVTCKLTTVVKKKKGSAKLGTLEGVKKMVYLSNEITTKVNPVNFIELPDSDSPFFSSESQSSTGGEWVEES